MFRRLFTLPILPLALLALFIGALLILTLLPIILTFAAIIGLLIFAVWAFFRVIETFSAQHAPSQAVAGESENRAMLAVASLRASPLRRRVADNAVMRAGQAPEFLALQVDDIGLLAYQGSDSAQIVRTRGVPSDVTHLRPFIVLNRTADQTDQVDQGADANAASSSIDSAAEAVRFNLIDADGLLRYTSRARYEIKRGQNFVTPQTWLPLDGLNMAADDDRRNANWTLHVQIGSEGALIAVHEFQWTAQQIAVTSAERLARARVRIGNDGEILDSAEPLYDLMSHHAARLMEALDVDFALSESDMPLSLDELLALQEIERRAKPAARTL